MIKTIESKIKNRIKASLQEKQPSAVLQHLNMFTGTWKVEGENHENAPADRNSKLVGEESYEWHSGNFFLINKWERHFENSEHIGIGMIGFDPAEHQFVVTHFDNLGFERIYKMTEEHKIWKLSGEKERAIIEFSNDGIYFKQKWEILDENSHWKPLCTIKGTKV